MVKYRSENTAADVGLFEGSTDVLGAASAGGRDKPPSRTLHMNHKRRGTATKLMGGISYPALLKRIVMCPSRLPISSARRLASS